MHDCNKCNDLGKVCTACHVPYNSLHRCECIINYCSPWKYCPHDCLASDLHRLADRERAKEILYGAVQ